MSSVKVIKRLGEGTSPTTKKSYVKDLITLQNVSPVMITESHTMQSLYPDSNPPPKPIDQFAPYLSRKLSKKRQEKIDKIKGPAIKETPTFALASVRSSSQMVTPRSPKRPAPDPFTPFEHEKIETPKNNEQFLLHLKMEDTFDKIASNSATTALHKLVESTLQIYFLADGVYFYHDIPAVKILYCPTTTNGVPHGTGLVGFTQFTREIVNCACASMHESYSPNYESAQIPLDSHVLSFPLFGVSGNVKAVIQVVRSKNSPIFNAQEESFVKYFQEKCKKYAPWLFQPVIDDNFIAELVETCRLKQFIEQTSEKLAKLFNCHEAEVWSYNTQTNIIYKYTSTSDQPIIIPLAEAGIAGYALRRQVPVSCLLAKIHSSYVAKADINGDFSVLTIPIRDQDRPIVYAVVLRGKRLPSFFTENDEKILSRIIPYIISSLNSALNVEKNYQSLDESMKQQTSLRSLLEVAEILSGELKIDDLIPKIMARACELVMASRCSLFLVNDTRDKLITTYSGGLKNAIEVPIKSGIVGYTATTGEVLNIKDAYEDPRFNRATDLKTGYRTVTVLCVPIFDNKGIVRGVTEMINKIDGYFSEEDVKLIQIFNVFTGISLDNAQLYKASLDLSLQMRTFMDMSQTLTQTSALKRMLEDILKNTRQVVGAVTGAIYIVEDNGISDKPTVMDEDMQSRMEYFEKLKKEEDGGAEANSLNAKRAALMRLIRGKQPGQSDLTQDDIHRKELVEKSVTEKQSIIDNDSDKAEKSMMVCPIISSDRIVLGAVLMQWKKSNPQFNYDDLRLLESYSVFLSISLERSILKKIAMKGGAEVELQSWLSQSERFQQLIPQKLKLIEEERKMIYSIDFTPVYFDGYGLFKVVFEVFMEFNLFQEFHINSETLFRFLHAVREGYNPVPYHNFLHAVDVMQFAVYLLKKSKLESEISKFEILGLIISCLCHDINHGGFSNSYNEKAQTPLGILYKNQSVLETHHCSVCISIMTREDCNLLKSLNISDTQKMWNLIINLILITDMAKHFEFLQELDKIINEKRDWRQNDSQTILQMIIKLSDISTIFRKFELADRWTAVLCEEFFRQGDLEKAAGMEYTSPLNDREHLDKSKSQIGFYTNVCLPFANKAAQILDGLDDALKNVNENLQTWKERVEQVGYAANPAISDSVSSILVPPPPPPT